MNGYPEDRRVLTQGQRVYFQTYFIPIGSTKNLFNGVLFFKTRHSRMLFRKRYVLLALRSEMLESLPFTCHINVFVKWEGSAAHLHAY